MVSCVPGLQAYPEYEPDLLCYAQSPGVSMASCAVFHEPLVPGHVSCGAGKESTWICWLRALH